MDIWLEDFNQYLTIAGFRGVKIKDPARFFQTVKGRVGNACVQFFDASLIAGPEHLRFATLNALKAFRSRINISKSLGMEILLYASARRQIKEALARMGVKSSTRNVVVLVLTDKAAGRPTILKTISELLRCKPDNSVIDLTSSKIANLKKLFGISDLELKARTECKDNEKQALMDLVIEHMALLVTQL